MLIVRCTAKLLRRLKVAPTSSSVASSNNLGDWYATILSVRPAHLVLLVNEPTRLAAMLPARQILTLTSRIPEAIAEVLRELGASDETVNLEHRAMAEVRFDRTANRSVLGTMNDYIFLIQWSAARQAPRDLLEMAMNLNHTPVGPLKYERPNDAARRRLGITGEADRGKPTEQVELARR